ncbi:PhnA domain-containing protein [Bacteroidia bacterium]|nr:PhnA domain-containing protein [Bacteroidia bacterium]MDC1394959.1 PhnA domain-containing protein [Bacteroidia bacterium]
MSVEQDLRDRGGDSCELCGSKKGLTIFVVAPKDDKNANNCVMTCETCNDQLTNPEKIDTNHWRCLNDSIWAEANAVKVVAWRTLTHLKGEGWPADLLDMMYMDQETEEWAKGNIEEANPNAIVHRDSNGVILEHGDSVVLIKDLPVKGSSMIAKRGTPVRNIRLDLDNERYIEGKVEGQTIVIITEYVKKT